MNIQKESISGRIITLMMDGSTRSSKQIAEAMDVDTAVVSARVSALFVNHLLDRITNRSGKTSPTYRINDIGMKAFDKVNKPKPVEVEPYKGEIVKPRQVNVLTSPELNPKHYLSNVPRREGSDSRVYKSKHV